MSLNNHIEKLFEALENPFNSEEDIRNCLNEICILNPEDLTSEQHIKFIKYHLELCNGTK